MIKENVRVIRRIIAESAKKSGRSPDEVKLIGVTKNMDVQCISNLLAAGVTETGENRVQEFLPKYEFFNNKSNENSSGSNVRPTNWHFIGHLQRNKVKFIAEKADLIHSVDSEALALEINRHGERYGKEIKILAEINISREKNKFGVPPKEIFKLVEKLEKLPFIRLSGLMCMAPFVENSEENRGYFSKMRNIIIDINNKFVYHSKLEDLSMGTSIDYATAIEEGATMIRLGTVLFNQSSQ